MLCFKRRKCAVSSIFAFLYYAGGSIVANLLANPYSVMWSYISY